MCAILELRELVAAIPGTDHGAAVSLPRRDAPLTVVTAGPAAATALARTVAGLAAPVSGRVLVAGHDVTDRPPGRRQIGYVPRGGALLPHLTVRENIEYLVWRQEAVHEIVRSWASALVYQLELGPVLDQLPHEITARQRMRAALARAAVSLPEVLVFQRPDPAATGPLGDLLARVASPVSPAPATVVFGDRPAGGTPGAQVADGLVADAAVVDAVVVDAVVDGS